MNAGTRSPIARFPQRVPEALRGAAVTIGNFDGVHRGHERVMAELRRVAGERPVAVVSFYPHPVRVLRKDAGLRYISSVREKAERLGELGVNLLYFVHFTRSVAEMSPQQFIERVLVESLGAQDLVVGDDVAIGKNREGNLAYLQRELPRYGITLHLVPKLTIDGSKAGSRRIREAIESGDVRQAASLIGAPFTISARVGHGDKRGTGLGFPTANIAVGSRLIPRRGVYACRVDVDGSVYESVANIGIRPTFHGSSERLEVHILDFPPQRLYEKRIHVSFIDRLRDERPFDSVDALKRQIAQDITTARELLKHG
jgi:riboflavin kinase/FMN adenylyltransferase